MNGSIHHAIQQLSYAAYTRDFTVHEDSSPKELGQVTLVAKQSDPAVQYEGLVNADRKYSYLPTKVKE